jgi:hypothetical protein
VCGCKPTTCADEGKDCGTISDGCGHDLHCGDCTGTKLCGGGGTLNVCGGCAPTTSCADQHKTCGSVDTGCGTQECGDCVAPKTCGGGGNPNACGCTPKTDCGAVECGQISNGCGGMLDCGGCDDHSKCTADTCSGGLCMYTLMCDADLCTDPDTGCP